MKRFNNIHEFLQNSDFSVNEKSLITQVSGYNRVLGIGLAAGQVAQENELPFSEVAILWNRFVKLADLGAASIIQGPYGFNSRRDECSDCGEMGVTKGHQSCEYPS